ncbi:MAG: amidase, partial [Ignavibacteriales bacterium]
MKTLIRFILLLFFSCLINSNLLPQKITRENIKNAEELTGLNFSDVERDSMMDNLKGQLDSYKRIRDIKLANNISPAILFNPIPVNFKFQQKHEPLQFSDYSYAQMPVDKNKLAFFSVGELAHLVKTRQITSTDLTRFFLGRLKTYNPVLHCVITLTEKRALKQAKLMDEELAAGKYRGLLHGIPFGVKD